MTTTTDQTTTQGKAPHPVSEWPEAKFPEPVDAEAPAWATRVAPWAWVHVDDVWQRTVRRPVGRADHQEVDVACFQNASADGTVTMDPPEIWLDLEGDTIDNAADARQLGQWLIEAAEVMERIAATQ